MDCALLRDVAFFSHSLLKVFSFSLNNLDDEEAIKKAESAKASAEEAAEAVQRALKCLGSAEKTAEQAQKY